MAAGEVEFRSERRGGIGGDPQGHFVQRHIYADRNRPDLHRQPLSVQSGGDAQIVLHPVQHDAECPVDHIQRGVNPHRGSKKQAAVGGIAVVEEAVVEVPVGHQRHGLGRLVERIFVPPGQHRA